MGEAIAILEAQGATIVRANIPTAGWIGGPGTEHGDPQHQPREPDPLRAGARDRSSSSTS